MAHWTDLTKDPNSPHALEARRQVIEAARRPPVPDRVEYLVSLARGKRVLDVGVVDHFAEARHKPTFLHAQIANAAGACLGVDIVADGVQQLQASGYNVRVADITSDSIEGEYDVIICGELIEHLGNPAGLFRNAHRLLVPGGRLVMTTPNPYQFAWARRYLRGIYVDSVDHVTLFHAGSIAELAEREGLVLSSYCGIYGDPQPKSLRARAALWIRPLLRIYLPIETFCERIIYECTKPAK